MAPALTISGALHRIHAMGDTGPTIRLADAAGPHRYALGALAGLAGEVTILNGQAFLARPHGATGVKVIASRSPTEAATLLVSAEVLAWTRHELGAASDLATAVAAAAKAAGAKPDDAFPFLVEGKLEDVRWHVVDAAQLPPGGGSCDDHAALGRKGTFSGDGLVLGFYSTRHAGTFTPPDARTHLHLVSADGHISGHVDAMPVPRDAALYLPAHAR